MEGWETSNQNKNSLEGPQSRFEQVEDQTWERKEREVGEGRKGEEEETKLK